MKIITVAEAEGRLSQIIYAVSQGESIILKDGDREICLSVREPGELNLEEDTPELESELLKSADQVPAPFSFNELREIGQQLIQEHRNK
jgi:hypothetical protein